MDPADPADAPTAAPARDLADLLDLRRAPVGWRARLDDLTGGLASAVLRPATAVVVVLGLVVAAAWWWRPRPPGEVPDLPPVEVEVADLPGATTATPAPMPPGAAAPAAEVTVHVVGAVAAPGLQHLPGGARVAEAVAAAGGPTPDADLERVNLAEPLLDGAQVRIPRAGEEQPPAVVPQAAASGPGAEDPAAGPVSLSRASTAELESLPGVGPATASAIVAHREANGPFRTVEDLLEVRGIGEKRLEALRDLVVP